MSPVGEAGAKAARSDGRLRRVEHVLEGPMVVLAFAWIGLIVVEFAVGQRYWLEWASNSIWVAFVMDFVLRLALADRRAAFLRRNWLTMISLLLPALRIFRLIRVLRLARATRGIRLVRLATSVNRSAHALMTSMERKGGGYVVALTGIVTVAGAAGMYALEENLFTSYSDALWWTAMIITTMGSDVWPHSPEGRILCLALAVYAFSVFGYVTAMLASFLVERGKPSDQLDSQRIAEQREQLRQEISRLIEALEKTDPNRRWPR